MQELFESLPWWMNPKYPMGRTDYFWASAGVGIIAILGMAATMLCIAVAYASNAGTLFTEVDFENIPDWVFASFIPWLFLLVPLQYRRCKAACIPYSVIWINMGLEIVDCLAWPDSPVTPITLFTTIIDFWILLAANKMDVVRTNPNPENLFPELK